MFRLDNNFAEALKMKYRQKPVCSPRSGQAYPYSVDHLILAITRFIKNELYDLNPELYSIFRSEKRYSRDTIYRLFKFDNPEYSPTRDIIDLLCYYTFGASYEACIGKKLVINNLSIFLSLKTRRIIAPPRATTEEIENKLMASYRKRIDLVIDNSDPQLIEAYLDENDLSILKALQPLQESMPDIHWNSIRERYSFNPKIVRGIKIKNDIDELIVGFYILYPITKKCQQQIEEGEIHKSDEFQIKDLCKGFEKASAIYISLVYSLPDYFAKSMLMLHLKNHILSIISENKDITKLYARPVTKAGERIAERSLFVKLHKDSALFHYKISVAQEADNPKN